MKYKGRIDNLIQYEVPRNDIGYIRKGWNSDGAAILLQNDMEYKGRIDNLIQYEVPRNDIEYKGRIGILVVQRFCFRMTWSIN